MTDVEKTGTKDVTVQGAPVEGGWGPIMSGTAVMGNTPFEVPLITHVVDDLWQGGCFGGLALPDDFEFVISLYPWEKYELPENCERFEYELYDSANVAMEDLLVEIAGRVNLCRISGKTLVHCQAGLNRSALVTALALHIDGMPMGKAIDLLRERRSPAVLCNVHFGEWLLNYERERAA